MKAGIIGGAGYIGSHVVLELLLAGHEVVILDDLSSGSRLNIPQDDDRVSFMEGDFTLPDVLSAFLSRRPDVLFHFAAAKAAGESMLVPEKYSRQNIRGTLQLLERLPEYGCQYFVFSSTAAVYGNPQKLPVDETHPLRPENYYGFTKLVIEEQLAWLGRLRGLRYAALRYFNAAGYDPAGRIRGLEKNPANLMPVLMEVATGVRSRFEIFGTDYATPDGTCIRDYIHVSDLARAHVLAMDYIVQKKDNLLVNLGTEQGLSVLEIYQAACEVVGRTLPVTYADRRAGDPEQLVASARKAHELLGWEARIKDPREFLSSMWQVYSA
ncbi:MAG: UDP-glucose 4-epimerase GalE [Spirochaetales bacterium]|nr:UDP-glucose 4-epimerase GalE [Spirochaetales bacterium]